MNDGNNNDDEINGTLNKSLSYSIDSQEIEEDIINAITEKNEIKKNVVEKLLHFYYFKRNYIYLPKENIMILNSIFFGNISLLIQNGLEIIYFFIIIKKYQN